MKKLTVCCLSAIGLGLLAVLLRILHILFYVDGVDCLSEEKGFSYWAFLAVICIAVLFTFALLILLKNRHFISSSDSKFDINRNIVPVFAIASNVAYLGYSLINGGGFFNGTLSVKVVYIALTVLYCGFCGYIIMCGENYLKNKLSAAVSLAPVMFYLFKLIIVFIYYTSNHRDFNYKELILSSVSLLLFFFYFAYHSFNGQYSKRLFVFGLFAIFAVSATWIPPLLTIRSAPVFNNDPITLLLFALVDISSAMFAYSVLRMYCKNK